MLWYKARSGGALKFLTLNCLTFNCLTFLEKLLTQKITWYQCKLFPVRSSVAILVESFVILKIFDTICNIIYI